MKKGLGLLLIGLMGCVGRPEQGYFPVASQPVLATVPAPSRDTAQTLTARHAATAQPPPSVGAANGGARSCVTRPAQRMGTVPVGLRRMLGRRVVAHSHSQTPVAQTPANHAVDGLGKLLLVAVIVAALILGTIVLAFTAPASVLGAIGKGALWALGGVLLVTLLNGAEQALFPDQRRK